MIDIIWEHVKNLTPNSAKCPKCDKVYTVNDEKWAMYKESPLTGKILNPLCCTGFWAIWRQGADHWEFQLKGRGRYVREPHSYSRRNVRQTGAR